MTVRGMMGLVAIVGFCAAMSRMHLALGCFLFSVLGLAAIRTSTSIDRLRARGTEIRSWVAARVLLNSLLVASTIIGISVLPGVASAYIFISARVAGHPGYLRPPPFKFALFYSFLAIPFVVFFKRVLW